MDAVYLVYPILNCWALLSLGYSAAGISVPKKLQRGAQPSPALNTSSLSSETEARTPCSQSLSVNIIIIDVISCPHLKNVSAALISPSTGPSQTLSMVS